MADANQKNALPDIPSLIRAMVIEPISTPLKARQKGLSPLGKRQQQRCLTQSPTHPDLSDSAPTNNATRSPKHSPKNESGG